MYVLENRRLVSYEGSTQHEGTTQQRKGRRRIYTQEERGDQGQAETPETQTKIRGLDRGTGKNRHVDTADWDSKGVKHREMDMGT